MRTITFYSYKGGVGRTLTAANFALYLASLGLKTIVMDFDLEAPGIDSKFPDFELSAGQMGVLDYILYYQENKVAPETLGQFCCAIPLEGTGDSDMLWLMPAGQYLSEQYYRNLSLLDWNEIFSAPEGVAFLQQIPRRIAEELNADFLIVDSRTGVTESAGICTQQLADEVVMLSSLSSESIKATAYIKQLIEQSAVAKELGKQIDVKVVVSRVPKPTDIDAFKERCSELFNVDETKLFFLFSSPALEQHEFLAIADRSRDEELTTSYVRLFYGLNIEIAAANIHSEIVRTTRDLLSMPPDQAERSILELVALYPHPEAYRKAVFFYRLVGNTEQMRRFCRKLLEFMPDDEEVQRILASSYLNAVDPYVAGSYTSVARRVRSTVMGGMDAGAPRLRPPNPADAVRAIDPLWQRSELTPQEALRYADLLEDAEQFLKSFEIASALGSDERLSPPERLQARSIAARTALELGQREIAADLIEGIPTERLGRALGREAIRIRQEAGDSEGALVLAKELLERDPSFLEQTVVLARQLDRMSEVEDLLRFSDRSRELARDPETRGELRRLGLSRVLRDIETRAL